MNTNIMFSSKNDNWETPKEIYEELNFEFNFTLDPCSDDNNHKCDKYFTKEQDGLDKCWKGERVFCNPPYGKAISKWVKKCYLHSLYDNGLAVMLLPARTDTIWFHRYIYNYPNAEVRFLKGRIKFVGALQPAPFPSMIVIFTPFDNAKSD